MIQLLQVSFKGWQLFPVVFLCLKFWSKYNQNGNKKMGFKIKTYGQKTQRKMLLKTENATK